MIESSGTRYTLTPWSEDVWVFDNWQHFLEKNSLVRFENFFKLTGDVVDINRRSVVHKITIGDTNKVFYLKIHEHYIKKISKLFLRLFL